jgi:hypothetical protein
MPLQLPETASPATRAIAEALEERGGLDLNMGASYAERIAFKETGGKLTTEFARKRADQLEEQAIKVRRAMLLAPLALVLSLFNLTGDMADLLPGWVWAFVIVAVLTLGGWQGAQWQRFKETVRLYDLLVTALAQDETRADREAAQGKALSTGEPLVALPEVGAEPEHAPFTRAARRRV